MTDLIKAAKLWAKTSQKTGGTYYVGRMGGCRVAAKAGQPDWRPPIHGFGWQPVTPDEHAEAVAHGEEIEERYRPLETQDAAAMARA